MDENNGGLLGQIKGLGQLYGIIVLLPMLLLTFFYGAPFFNLFLLANRYMIETPEQVEIVEQVHVYYVNRHSDSDATDKIMALEERYLAIASSEFVKGANYNLEKAFFSFLEKPPENALGQLLFGLILLAALAVMLYFTWVVLWAVGQFFKFIRENILVRITWISACVVNLLVILSTIPTDSSMPMIVTFHVSGWNIVGAVFTFIFAAMFVLTLLAGRQRVSVARARPQVERMRDKTTGRFVKSHTNLT